MTFRNMGFRAGIFTVFAVVLFVCWHYYRTPAKKIYPVHFKSGTELTEAIRQGKITSSDLLNLYLERIERYNADVNAVVALDIDAARARAAEADKALSEGQLWGPLHGLPMTVKDTYEVVGMPTTSGDPELKDYMPERNAVAVQRLINAGAIIFGKTNVPYHAMDFQSYNNVYGTTNNPWDLSRTPGGSSGGASAALAAGFTSIELGSDFGGSIRTPAGYTGVFGHKPTFGIVPRYGHIPPMPGQVPPHVMPMIPLWVAGPLARSADDLDLALLALTTPGSEDETDIRSKLPAPRRRLFQNYRVAAWFTDSYPEAEIDADVLKTLRKTVTKLRGAGLDVVEIVRPVVDLAETRRIFSEISDCLMKKQLPLPEELVARQKKQQEKWAAFFETYDVLLAPVSPTVAFPHDHKEPISSRKLVVNGREKPMLDNLTWALMAIVSGLPATVAPVGLSESGLPVGIQIIGGRFEDRTTIAFAKGISGLVGGFSAPPGY